MAKFKSCTIKKLDILVMIILQIEVSQDALSPFCWQGVHNQD